jgi:hypothetical protein
VFQRHHVAPCVFLGLAAAGDRWCQGCTLFVSVSMQVQIDAEEAAARRALLRR